MQWSDDYGVFISEGDVVPEIRTTPDITYKYSEVEDALLSLHDKGIDDVESAHKRKTIRARILHFQRLGLVPSAPGRGQKIRYRVADIIRWAICIELTQLGLPPEQVRDVFRLCGISFFHAFEGPIPDEDLIFILSGNFLDWHLNSANKEKTYVKGTMMSGILPASEVSSRLFGLEKLQRVLMINMTHVKRQLGKALKIEWH
jgi:hypothetical protein